MLKKKLDQQKQYLDSNYPAVYLTSTSQLRIAPIFLLNDKLRHVHALKPDAHEPTPKQYSIGKEILPHTNTPTAVHRHSHPRRCLELRSTLVIPIHTRVYTSACTYVYRLPTTRVRILLNGLQRRKLNSKCRIRIAE